MRPIAQRSFKHAYKQTGLTQRPALLIDDRYKVDCLSAEIIQQDIFRLNPHIKQQLDN